MRTLKIALGLLTWRVAGCDATTKLDRRDGAPPPDRSIVKDALTELDLEVLWTIDSASVTSDCVKLGRARAAFDILVGAGPTNPTRAHDVPRILTAGACRP